MEEYFNWSEIWLMQAEQFYSGSLDIIENPDTRHNYDYVKDLLEKQEEEEKNKQEEKKEDTQSEDGQEEKENSENQEESESEENEWNEPLEQNWEEGSEERSESENGDKEEALTENEKQQLKKITEQIKAEQNYNQRYFNKAEQGSNFQSSFESFFWEVDRGWEKDW